MKFSLEISRLLKLSKSKMKLFLSFILVLSSFSLSAQQIADDLTENFAFQVKTIDDFIERFNFETGTEFVSYLQTHYPKNELNRKSFLFSLFNFKNKSFYNNEEVYQFIYEVTDSLRPRYIHFSDYDWYALVECRVMHKKAIKSLELILKVERDINRSMKWSIVSAKADFLGASELLTDSMFYQISNDYLKNRMRDSSRYFLHPVSHAIDFMNVDVAFTKKKRFEDYFYAGPKSGQLMYLNSLVQNSEITFLQVNTISYHLLQIKGWILILDYFNRIEKNSGWMINSLMRANPAQKRIYLENHLNIKLD